MNSNQISATTISFSLDHEEKKKLKKLALIEGMTVSKYIRKILHEKWEAK